MTLLFLKRLPRAREGQPPSRDAMARIISIGAILILTATGGSSFAPCHFSKWYRVPRAGHRWSVSAGIVMVASKNGYPSARVGNEMQRLYGLRPLNLPSLMMSQGSGKNLDDVGGDDAGGVPSPTAGSYSKADNSASETSDMARDGSSDDRLPFASSNADEVMEILRKASRTRGDSPEDRQDIKFPRVELPLDGTLLQLIPAAIIAVLGIILTVAVQIESNSFDNMGVGEDHAVVITDIREK